MSNLLKPLLIRIVGDRKRPVMIGNVCRKCGDSYLIHKYGPAYEGKDYWHAFKPVTCWKYHGI